MRIITAVLAGCLLGASASAQQLTQYVDPYIGAGGHGHVFVGASVPFGAVQAGPENFFKGWDWDSGYNYGDSVLTGFSHLHLSGTGIGELGDVLVMPFTGAVKTDKGVETVRGSGYASRYSHQHETVKPGYYSVLLEDYGIKAEMTTTERVALHHYQFPAAQAGHVIIDLKEGTQNKTTDSYIAQLDDSTFVGYRFSTGWAKSREIYFCIRTSQSVRKWGIYDGDTLLQGREGKGPAMKCVLDVPGQELMLKVGLSPVSFDNALKNIQQELPGWNFAEVAHHADALWNKELSKIQVQAGTEAGLRTFYTALFHTMIDPAIFNDCNGEYRGADKKVHKDTFTNYSIFSLWDTYRAVHPLFTLIQPDKAGDMVNTMLAIYRQQGKLPIWHLNGYETGTMVGFSSLQVIAEACLKGIKGFDANAAFEAVKATAMTDTLGMSYVKAGRPVASDQVRSSVARAMEYCISDASIALMAKKLGKTADAAYFSKRAGSYKLYFDPSTRFFRGRLADGSMRTDFNPMKAPDRDYTEGNAWQYEWLVPEDVTGLAELLGGEQAFTARLDSFFSIEMTGETLADLTGLIGQYAHGNEPGHHIAYLYAFMGQQWKTAEKTRQIMQSFYHDQPDGVVGNEDCGQMSAWYVFSALGFYPVFPASGMYVIGSPLVDKATLKMPSGKDFVLTVVNNSPENKYVQKVELNGKAYTKSYLWHSDIVKGGTLKIYMGAQPDKAYGAAPSDRPQSTQL